MQTKLHYETVTSVLSSILNSLMKAEALKVFRLVGGTALSLYRGHRRSADIDLFTDADYGSVDFIAIDSYLRTTFHYVDSTHVNIIGMGKSYFVGSNPNECIKLDIYYTDKFIQNVEIIDDIRFASIEEILAMKIDVISRGGRKKDFWDIHEFMDEYSLKGMLDLHEKRYPYGHNEELILNKLTDFAESEYDFYPVCLKNKHWEIIKLDIIDFVKNQHN